MEVAMRKITVELDADVVDRLLVEEIKAAVEQLEGDLALRKQGLGLAVFSVDCARDVAEIEFQIEALVNTAKWFGAYGEWVEQRSKE